MELIAENVQIAVGAEFRSVYIYVNKYGNLELRGIGAVVHDMLDEEISFVPAEVHGY
jgi:hypothetical protein